MCQDSKISTNPSSTPSSKLSEKDYSPLGNFRPKGQRKKPKKNTREAFKKSKSTKTSETISRNAKTSSEKQSGGNKLISKTKILKP